MKNPRGDPYTFGGGPRYFLTVLLTSIGHLSREIIWVGTYIIVFQNLKSSVPVTEEIMCVNMTSISGPVLHSFGQRLEKKLWSG